jgi:hypothetical protein
LKRAIDDWKFILAACLTLGLAPYYPTPHILTRGIWLLEGAQGGDWLDWLDLLVHAAPWILLGRLFALGIYRRVYPAKRPQDENQP